MRTTRGEAAEESVGITNLKIHQEQNQGCQLSPMDMEGSHPISLLFMPVPEDANSHVKEEKHDRLTAYCRNVVIDSTFKALS